MTAGACGYPHCCCGMPCTCNARPPGVTRTSFPIPSSCTSQVGAATPISPSYRSLWPQEEQGRHAATLCHQFPVTGLLASQMVLSPTPLHSVCVIL